MLTVTESIYHAMLLSAGLFRNTEEETEFHAAKSFDSVLCSKSEIMILLATIKGKDSSDE